MHQLSLATEIAVGLSLIVDQERPFVLWTMQFIFSSKTQNWLDTEWWQFRFKWFAAIVADVSDLWPWPFQIFLPPLCHLCCVWWVLRHESRFSWMICGVQWYAEKHQSMRVFVFSSVVAFVSNGSIRATIFIQRYGCLNIEKWVYNLNMMRSIMIRCFIHASFVSVAI